MTDPKARQRESARKWARKERAKLKAQGLVPVTVYVRPEDRERVKAVAQRLNLARDRMDVHELGTKAATREG